MPKVSLSGFKDPLRRPRYIIWTGAAVLVLAAFVVVSLGATSTNWFCAEVCHQVQADAVISFERSSHSTLECIACHMKVNADPVTFVFHKVESLGKIYLTARKRYSMPLNATSDLALDAKYMGSAQCTQCHNLATRPVTPSPGIIIDHDVHTEAEIHCTVCHNRVAHREDFELTLTDPNTGEPSRKHEDFMLMTACFRCHTLTGESPGGIVAPGACEACHTPDFELRPASHFEDGFYPRGHADLALAELEQDAQAAADDGSAYAAEEETLGPDAPMYQRLAKLPSVTEIDYCSTCHVTDTFCGGCHGMEMPHPVEFVEKTHSENAATQPEKCVMCHTAADPAFCDSCHHGVESGWEFTTEVAWGGAQHAEAVRTNGVPGCLGVCHEPAYCQDCHTATNPLPTSHGAADWLRRPAAELGQHAVDANNEISACEVCHGDGGANATFCKSCHVVDLPHPQEFRQFHAFTGRSNPQACSNCHTYVELCSDCHHEGAIDGQPWLRVHANITNEQGAEGCFEMCHDRAFCVDCHISRTVLPESHQAGDWTRRATIDAPARHPAAFDEQPENCSYCHGDGGAKAKFCTDCHKLEMPHQPDFKETHAPSFREQEFAKPVCMNCHSQYFCDRCHHEGATGTRPWTREHAPVVKDKGAEPCFVCHETPTCAACHVRLGR